MSGPLSSVCFLVAQYFIRFEAGFSSKICSHPLIPKCKKLRSSNVRIGLAKDVNGTELDLGLASCTSALAFSAALRILSACGASKLTIHSFNKQSSTCWTCLINRIWIHLSDPVSKYLWPIYGQIRQRSKDASLWTASFSFFSASTCSRYSPGISQECLLNTL